MFDSSCMSHYLPVYYKKLFPCKLLAKWLRYGQNDYFQRREFAFILPDDVYLRYKSYNDTIQLETDILKTCPEKIDIGAVYNYKPKENRNRKDMGAVERELVFDIDMTDYDDVRTCCKAADVCKKCWTFMVIAVKIIDAALEEDFAFHQRLWVFSGRRGVHCWVCDENARKLSSAARSAIVEYLSLISGGENRKKKVELKGVSLHPSIKRASAIVEKQFLKLLLDQGWLDDEEKASQLTSLIVDEGLRKQVESDMAKCSTATERWKFLCVRRAHTELPKGSNFFLEEIMLQQAYPRLDVNVTKGLNHLLKSPFCVHPKTGKICIPFDLSETNWEDFDPEMVPRLDNLYSELTMDGKEQNGINAFENENENSNRKILFYKKTSMKKHIEFFERFVSAVCPVVSKDNEGKNANFKHFSVCVQLH